MSNILCCPYIAIPLLAALWAYFKLPKFNWRPLLMGAMLSLAGDYFKMASRVFAPFTSYSAGMFFHSFFGFLGDICWLLGLTLIAFFAIYEALLRL